MAEEVMGYFPVAGGSNTGKDYGTTAASTTVALLTSSGVANTKTSTPDQIVASTARNAVGMLVTIMTASLANTDYLVDIMVGANPNEKVIASNLHFNSCAVVDTQVTYTLPIEVPAGTRISARQQSSGAATTCRVGLEMIYGGLHTPRFSICESVGALTASSLLPAMSHPASANTKGGYQVILASTTRRYKAFLVKSGKGQANATQFWLVDIAIGAAASEKIIIPDLHFGQNTTSDEVEPPIAGPFYVDVPSGTRMSANIQIDVTGAGRDFWLGLYGLI
jgi:hypothetical protein